MTYKIHAKRFRSDISYKDKWREGNLSHKILKIQNCIRVMKNLVYRCHSGV